ncbi:hypothetical protein [Streptomyces jumonjinensis]|uniref:hypothetical protein n=1 Tax=Streptomyces jumonjinensis TaxID=1945 RepID=UPI003797D070
MLRAAQTGADTAGGIEWLVSVDSTVVRAHRHAAGARKGGSALRPEVVRSRLSELADWHPIGEESWYTRGSRGWWRIVHDLQSKAEEARRHGTR